MHRLFTLLLLGVTACGTERRGPLAALADSLVPHDAPCAEHALFDNVPAAPYNVAHPPIQGCFDTTRSPRTLLLIDSEDRVIEVTQLWEFRGAAVDSTFDALRGALVHQHGSPVLECLDAEGYAASRELMWRRNSGFIRLKTGRNGLVAMIHVLGEPSCTIGPAKGSSSL